MIIDDALLSRLEKLSYLKIPNEQRERMINDLQEFVEFANNLSELDTSSVDEQFSLLNSATPLRHDESAPKNSTAKEILEHAPARSDDFFIVPKIIE